MFNTEDVRFLNRCLQLAAFAGASTQPNPMVGCVIVHNGIIIGEGYHHGPGLPHAEPEALNSVIHTRYLSEATLYVNLEPCNHFGRTPPCSEAIISAGIPKVVVGMQDPHPLVSGKGIQRLRDAGIEVVLAPNPEPFRRFNKIFIHNILHHTAWCTLKWAEDTAGQMGDQFHRIALSGIKTLPFVHQLRAQHQAIMIGANTAKIDQPRLNTRYFPGPHPLCIISDPEGLVSPEDLRNIPPGKVLWLVKAPRIKGQIQAPAEVFDDLKACMKWLYSEHNICSVLVEGGRMLLQKCIDQNAWNTMIRILTPLQKSIHTPVMAPQFKASAGMHTEVIPSGRDEIHIWEYAIM